MNTEIPLIAAAVLVGLIVFSGWPLLRLPRMRATLYGVGGSSCIGIGSAMMAALVGGFLPSIGTQAVADDKQAVAEASASQSTAAEPNIPTAEADPEIDAPAGSIEIPPGRPKWVGSEPNLRGKIHTVSVASGPYATDAESKRALDEALVKATNRYVAEQVGSEMAPKLIRFNARTIKKRFVKDENRYHDVARYSDPVGWMHENFALLEFGPDFRNELDRRWTSVRATSRLTQTGLVSGGVLLLLSTVFGYFRADHATRGYYTRRLQVMAAAGIVAVITAGAVFSQWITWL